jgi:deoxycitidine kinase/deoxyguanosine kinase
MKTTIISIEGNIGSGKSTLFEKLKIHFSNNKNIIFVREPVDIWESIQDENGTTILEKFYQDQIKYSFSFQIMAYISRINLLKETIKQHPGVTIITERSLYTDKMVFAKMLYDTHKIEYINYQIYLNLFDTFKNDFNVNNIIYIKTDPDICCNRILKRARNGENNISLDYLQLCDTYHNNMVDILECDKIVLNGNVDIYENTSQLNDWICQIQDIIKY